MGLSGEKSAAGRVGRLRDGFPSPSPAGINKLGDTILEPLPVGDAQAS